MSLEAFAEDGRFAPSRIATALRTTLDEVARTVGLGRDAVMRQDRIASPKTQKRLREMVEILNRVEPRFGSALIAYAWYRSEPLAGFGGLTAMQLVREGHAGDVLEYIDAVDAGIHAWPMHFQGLMYRAINPIRAREPQSGEGARLHGGRFNPKGIPALYTALSVMTAIREANQVGTLQPTTLVCYEADITSVFDATDADALGTYDMTLADLAAEDWRLQMRANGKAPTQILAEKLIADGYAGLRVPSFAKGASGEDLNMVLWVWGSTPPTKLVLIDDEGRLLQ